MSDIAEFENMMSLDQPLQSTKLCRWERKQRQGEVLADRFIPNRSAMEKSLSQPICENENPRNDDVPELSEHAKLLAAGTSDNTVDPNTRVLAYKNKAPAPKDGYQNSLKVLYSQQAAKKVDAKPTRHIASAPIRILDAPDLLDDYCKSLM
jgi:cell division cycle protein 20 (cofactor of APC complex)